MHDLMFEPLAKWAMLQTRKYRRVTSDGAIDIEDVVRHTVTLIDASSPQIAKPASEFLSAARPSKRSLLKPRRHSGAHLFLAFFLSQC
jgi:hypothetical protein